MRELIRSLRVVEWAIDEAETQSLDIELGCSIAVATTPYLRPSRYCVCVCMFLADSADYLDGGCSPARAPLTVHRAGLHVDAFFLSLYLTCFCVVRLLFDLLSFCFPCFFAIFLVHLLARCTGSDLLHDCRFPFDAPNVYCQCPPKHNSLCPYNSLAVPMAVGS